MAVMRGLTITENPMGFTAVRLHYVSDPSKDPQNPDPAKAAAAIRWLDAQKIQWPDPNDFEREFEINFFISKGTRVFPQFNQTIHTQPGVLLRHRVVYRSWDFGWHCPVCLLAQIDKQGRLCVIREIVGRQKDISDFAGDVIAACERWYPLHAAGYEDFCDPAGQQVNPISNDKNERREVDVLSGLAIHAKYQYGWSRKDGRMLIHRLLALRADGTPGLFVDAEQAPTVLQAFLGRYVYPETRDGKIKDAPDDETHPWSDVMAALRYLVIGLQGRLGMSTYRLAEVAENATSVDYHGYGIPNSRTIRLAK